MRSGSATVVIHARKRFTYGGDELEWLVGAKSEILTVAAVFVEGLSVDGVVLIDNVNGCELILLGGESLELIGNVLEALTTSLAA